jgi:hypothetical protein
MYSWPKRVVSNAGPHEGFVLLEDYFWNPCLEIGKGGSSFDPEYLEVTDIFGHFPTTTYLFCRVFLVIRIYDCWRGEYKFYGVHIDTGSTRTSGRALGLLNGSFIQGTVELELACLLANLSVLLHNWKDDQKKIRLPYLAQTDECLCSYF